MSISMKLFTLFLIFCSFQHYVSSDSFSVGISTCTKYDNEGDVKTFVCPDTFDVSKHYCCGLPNFQYCCDEETFNTYNTLSGGIIAAIVIGCIVIVAGFILLICCCCSCCCLAQRRRGVILSPSPATTIHQPIFVPQGYYQMPSQQTRGQNGPEMMGKPPPYYESP